MKIPHMMKRDPEHLSPHQYISPDYEQLQRVLTHTGRYMFRIATQQERRIGVGDLQREIDSEAGEYKKAEQVVPPNAERYEAEAREFVAQLTGIDCEMPVNWPQSIDGGAFTGRFGGYHGVIEVADVKSQPGTDWATEHYIWMANVSILVHEMTHSTSILTRRVTAFDSPNSPAYTAGMMTTTVPSPEIVGQPYRKGIFLEEACAEEAAARWRESVEPIRRQTDYYHQLLLSNGESLPWRYFQTQGPLDESSTSYEVITYGWSNSAYCAEAVRLLSEHTGVDIFELMIMARHPEYETEAKRAIVQTIEGVKRGLYKQLRDLEYNQEDFIKGLHLAIDAIQDDRRASETEEHVA